MMRKNNITEKRAFKTRASAYGTMLRKDFIRNRSLYVLAIPVIAYFIIFKYIPMYGLLMAFEDYSPRLGITGSEWVGLKHFRTFLSTPSFWSVVRNTLSISISQIIFGFPIPIILALLLNEVRSVKYSRFIQNLTYIPHFISLVVVCGLITTFVSSDGIIGGFFSKYADVKGSMLIYPKYFLPIYLISGIWQSVGWDSIIYLSALTGVDESLYEAARVDGAGRWKQTIHITIPSILPVIITMLLLQLGGVLTVGYEKVLLLQNDSTLEVSEIISSYVYRRGLVNLDWSYSTAVNLFNSVINIIILLASQAISRKVSGYTLW